MSLDVSIRRASIAIFLLVVGVLVATTAGAQIGFPNVERTPGELLTPGPQGFGSDGRGAIIAFHGGLLYTVPEHPSSAAGSSLDIKIWDISTEQALRQPRLVENLGRGPMNMQAHGYVLHDNRLQLGGDNWSFERTGFQQYQRRFWQAGLNNVVFDRGLLVPGWNVGFHTGGISALGNWFYQLDERPFGIARRGNPASLLPTEQWAVWDHLNLSAGVKGMPLIFGDLLLIGSEEQTMSGLAIYDLKPTYRQRGTPPTLLSTFKQGGTGGYWPELWGQGDRLYVFFPRRNEGLRGWQIVDVSDPTAPSLVSDVALTSQDGPMYVQFQDQFAFTGRFKLDMLSPDQPVLTLPVQQPGFVADTSQFALPLGNLLVTGGLGDLENQAWRIWAHQAEPDTRGPSVGYHRPRPNQTQWPRQAPLAFLIHETLRVETIVNGQSVILRPVGGQPLDAAINFSSGQQLNLVPTAPLAANTEYEVVFPAGGIRDVAGNGIAGYSFRFSTGGNAGGNQPPLVASLTALPYPASPQQAVAFDAVASDPEAGPLMYRYSFGDGFARDWSNNPDASHAYAQPGRYQALLQVRDAQGAIASRAVRVTVMTPSGPPQPRHSSAMAASADGQSVWVVNPDGDSIARVRTSDGQRTGEFSVSADPRSVGLDAQGRVWVACHDADRIDVLDPASGAQLHSISTGYGSAPMAIVFDPAGQRAYVSLSGGSRVLRIDQASLQQSSVATGPKPHALAISGDGQRLLATRFISATDHGEVYDIATGSMSLTRTIVLPMRTIPNETSADARGVPNYLAAIAIQPDGRRAWVTAKKDNITRGLQFFDARHELDPDSTVRAQLIAIDLATHRQDDTRTRDLDNSDSPSGLAFSPLGDYLFVALQGHDEVLAFDVLKVGLDARQQGVVGRYPVGSAPQGLLTTAGSAPQLLTQNFLGRSISRLALGDFLAGTSVLGAPANTATASNETLNPAVLAGKRIFYRAADPRMSLEGYLSCATCHIDGGSDGRVWDFTGRGEGLRNNIDLRGRAGTAHGAVHWTGNFDEIQDFENDIRLFFGGRGLMSDADFAATADPLGAPKAGRSEALDSLAAYVASLGVGSLPRSPHRLTDGRMSPAAERGRLHFDALGCADCHVAAQGYRDGLRHDVGTLRATSGRRINQPIDGIDTPTLLGAWDNPPYLHDGAAQRLEDVFSTSGGPRYPAENAQLAGGARLVNQFIDINNANASFGHFVEFDTAGARATFAEIDGGAGGIGRLELRINLPRNSGSFELTVRVNGQSFPVSIPALGEHVQWRSVAVEGVVLQPGETNSIELRAQSGGFPFLSIDQITVSRPNELTLAAPHRAALTLTPSGRADLLAYLRELDGRDANGSLPGPTVPQVFADGFESAP